MAPHASNSRTPVSSHGQDAARRAEAAESRLVLQLVIQHQCSSILCAIISRLRNPSNTTGLISIFDIAIVPRGLLIDVHSASLSALQGSVDTSSDILGASIAVQSVPRVCEAMAERRKSKLPRPMGTPTPSTPQSQPRYRAVVYACDELLPRFLQLTMTQDSGSRIPRPSDGSTPSRASTKTTLATNKPLPSAPRVSTLFGKPEIHEHITSFDSQVHPSGSGKTVLDLVGTLRKPSPNSTTPAARASSTVPLSTDKFIVRRLRTTSPAGEGPVLRISDDANSIIFGNTAPPRSVSPATGDSTPDDDDISLSRQRTLEALEGRRELSGEPDFQLETFGRMKKFVDQASQYHSDGGSVTPPPIPPRLRPVEMQVKQSVLSRRTDMDKDEIHQTPASPDCGDDTPGLAITTATSQEIEAHQRMTSDCVGGRGSPAESCGARKSMDESIQLSNTDISRHSRVDPDGSATPPYTPLLEAPSSASTMNLSHPGMPRLVSRLPVARSSATPPRPLAKFGTGDRTSSASKDRRSGFRLPTKSSSAALKSSIQATKKPDSRFSLLKDPPSAVLRPHRTPVRTILSDLVRRHKSKRDLRPQTPQPPYKPALVQKIPSPTIPVPKGITSLRKSRRTAVAASSAPPAPTAHHGPDAVDRHNAAMAQAQRLRARIRHAAGRMAVGRDKLNLLEATEMLNGTAAHSVAALAASERARVSALEARRYWELTLAALYANMGMLESRVGVVESAGCRKRRGSF